MPVIVATVGILLLPSPDEVRRPAVRLWSDDCAGIIVPSGLTASGGEPGNTPAGLAGVGVPVKDGAVPPCKPMPPPRMRKLPRNQSKPRAFASLWLISVNFASIE